MAEHEPSNTQHIVLTGGSGVGKTTLIERLAALGYTVVPEAAMRVIELLNNLLDDGQGGGPAQQLAWRTKHKAAFGDLLGSVAMTQESQAVADPGTPAIFLDRSVLDNLGYARVRGYQPPDFITTSFAKQHAAQIDRVFVLAPLSGNGDALEERNRQTGRATDPGASSHVSEVMFEVYSELGCKTMWLPDASVQGRLEQLLAACGLPPPSEPAPLIGAGQAPHV